MADVKIETYTGGIAATNGHLLKLPGGTLLVDAPEGVADWLDANGVKVNALLLTHQHFDHVLDAAKVRSRHGCRVFSWAAHSVNLTLERLFGAVTGTSMAVTPSIFESAFLIVIGQAAQFMPGTDSVTVLLDAWAGRVATISRRLFMGVSSRGDTQGRR